MTIVFIRASDGLPAGFAELEADAKADGHAHLTRLSAEFASDPAMFHAIVIARIDGELAGIGAITDEPAPASPPAWRMRRFYVHRRFRRRNLAGGMAAAMLREAARHVRVVTVHAGNYDAARFWEAIGFRRVSGRDWSHEKPVGP
jgi:GNAT superfamily N-acetyltransferase